MPTISVIITSHNCAPYIRAAIESIQAQTCREWDLIIIDDGSTDATPDIIRAAIQQEPRANFIQQPHAGRAAITRNTGLKHATGEYVCFLDGDDLYHPGKLAKMLKMLDHSPDLVAAFHDVQLIEADGTPRPGTYLNDANFLDLAHRYMEHVNNDEFRTGPDFYMFQSLRYAAMHTSSVIIRRSAFPNLRFPEDVSVGEDTETWWRIAKTGPIGYLDQPLSYYRQHSTSVTGDKRQYWRDLIKIHERNYASTMGIWAEPDRERYRHKIADHYSELAYLYMQAGERKQARSLYSNAREWNRWSKYLIAYLKTWIPRLI